jgi:choline-glycine betaine transporter
MGSLSERGTISPSRRIVVFWGVVMGAVAAIMLLVGGDDALTGLQNLTIIAALPFALVMVGLAVSLAKDLRSDPLMLRRAFASEAVEQAVVEGITRHGEDFQLVVEPAPTARAERNSVTPLPTEDEMPAGRPQDPRD